MMTSNQDQHLFEQLRNLPPELSREQVEQMIILLPTLPPPSSSWFSFNTLNSIIMTTTIISTIAILSFYLFNGNIATTNTNMVENTATMPVLAPKEKAAETFVTDIEAPEKETKISKEIEPKVKPNMAPFANTKKPIRQEENKIQNNILDKNNKSLTVAPTPPITKKKVKNLALLEKQKIVSPLKKPEQYALPNFNKPLNDTSWGEPICNDENTFEGNIRTFKSQFIRHLERSGLINSSKEKIRFYFTPDRIVVNHQIVPKHWEQKFHSFLAEYHIYPCEQQVIESTRQYIAIGVMSNRGFKGRTSGTVDVTVLNNIPRSPLLKSSLQKDSSINSTENKKSPCLKLLVIEEYNMERLHEELLDLLKTQPSLKKSADVIARFDMKEQQLFLNQQALNAEQSEEYFALLQQYDIAPCEQRTIQVNKHFLAIGDVLAKGFRGTVLGKKMVITSVHGTVDIKLGTGYGTMNMVDWGTILHLTD